MCWELLHRQNLTSCFPGIIIVSHHAMWGKRSVPIRYSASVLRSGIPYNFLNVSSHHCKGSSFPYNSPFLLFRKIWKFSPHWYPLAAKCTSSPTLHREAHIWIFRLTLARIQAAPFESCPAKTERGKTNKQTHNCFPCSKIWDISEQAWFLLQTQVKALIHSFSLSFLLNIVREYRDLGGGTWLTTYPRCPRKCRTGNSWQAQLVVNGSSWDYLSWWHCCHVLECFVLCCLIL